MPKVVARDGARTIVIVDKDGKTRTWEGKPGDTPPAWVQALRPRWAVVQAGYRNRFGHPVPDVMHRYEDVGTQMVQNDSCGAASWSSWQPDQMRCERQQRLRYWDAFAVRTPPQGAR